MTCPRCKFHLLCSYLSQIPRAAEMKPVSAIITHQPIINCFFCGSRLIVLSTVTAMFGTPIIFQCALYFFPVFTDTCLVSVDVHGRVSCHNVIFPTYKQAHHNCSCLVALECLIVNKKSWSGHLKLYTCGSW